MLDLHGRLWPMQHQSRERSMPHVPKMISEYAIHLFIVTHTVDPLWLAPCSTLDIKIPCSSDAFRSLPTNQAWICFTLFNWSFTALASPPAKGSPQATTSPLLVRAAKAACVAWIFSTSFLRQAPCMPWPWRGRGMDALPHVISEGNDTTNKCNGPRQSNKCHFVKNFPSCLSKDTESWKSQDWT